jgi:hypothetical protein
MSIEELRVELNEKCWGIMDSEFNVDDYTKEEYNICAILLVHAIKEVVGDEVALKIREKHTQLIEEYTKIKT